MCRDMKQTNSSKSRRNFWPKLARLFKRSRRENGPVKRTRESFKIPRNLTKMIINKFKVEYCYKIIVSRFLAKTSTRSGELISKECKILTAVSLLAIFSYRCSTREWSNGQPQITKDYHESVQWLIIRSSDSNLSDGAIRPSPV